MTSASALRSVVCAGKSWTARGMLVMAACTLFLAASPWQAQAAPTQLIANGETWRYFKGTTEPPADWKEVGFNDAVWLLGPSGFGYGDNDDATILKDMRNGYVSLYVRKSLFVANPSTVTYLTHNVGNDIGGGVYFGIRFSHVMAYLCSSL
ncbi:MAG: hypothetical protein FJ319_07795 [SAR202 cluster bacterium]|nr:hypothetical protein [SAR202 cluster bacterium]